MKSPSQTVLSAVTALALLSSQGMTMEPAESKIPSKRPMTAGPVRPAAPATAGAGATKPTEEVLPAKAAPASAAGATSVIVDKQ